MHLKAFLFISFIFINFACISYCAPVIGSRDDESSSTAELPVTLFQNSEIFLSIGLITLSIIIIAICGFGCCKLRRINENETIGMMVNVLAPTPSPRVRINVIQPTPSPFGYSSVPKTPLPEYFLNNNNNNSNNNEEIVIQNKKDFSKFKFKFDFDEETQNFQITPSRRIPPPEECKKYYKLVQASPLNLDRSLNNGNNNNGNGKQEVFSTPRGGHFSTFKPDETAETKSDNSFDDEWEK